MLHRGTDDDSHLIYLPPLGSISDQRLTLQEVATSLHERDYPLQREGEIRHVGAQKVDRVPVKRQVRHGRAGELRLGTHNAVADLSKLKDLLMG